MFDIDKVIEVFRKKYVHVLQRFLQVLYIFFSQHLRFFVK